MAFCKSHFLRFGSRRQCLCENHSLDRVGYIVRIEKAAAWQWLACWLISRWCSFLQRPKCFCLWRARLASCLCRCQEIDAKDEYSADYHNDGKPANRLESFQSVFSTRSDVREHFLSCTKTRRTHFGLGEPSKPNTDRFYQLWTRIFRRCRGLYSSLIPVPTFTFWTFFRRFVGSWFPYVKAFSTFQFHYDDYDSQPFSVKSILCL